jgi:hypothetical protein
MSQDKSQGSWRAYRRERLNRFRHALVQLHGHADRFRGCPEGQVPRLFADVYLTTDFITGHRKVVDLLEIEIRQSGAIGEYLVNEVYDDVFDGGSS